MPACWSASFTISRSPGSLPSQIVTIPAPFRPIGRRRIERVHQRNAAVRALRHAFDVFAFAIGTDHQVGGILPLPRDGIYLSVISRAIFFARVQSSGRADNRARCPGSSGIRLGMPFSRRALARYSAMDSSSPDQTSEVASLESHSYGSETLRSRRSGSSIGAGLKLFPWLSSHRKAPFARCRSAA